MDLNEPYLQTNIDLYKNGQVDYLSSMAPPEGMAPPVPLYVNSNVRANDNGKYINLQKIPMSQLSFF